MAAARKALPLGPDWISFAKAYALAGELLGSYPFPSVEQRLVRLIRDGSVPSMRRRIKRKPVEQSTLEALTEFERLESELESKSEPEPGPERELLTFEYWAVHDINIQPDGSVEVLGLSATFPGIVGERDYAFFCFKPAILEHLSPVHIALPEPEPPPKPKPKSKPKAKEAAEPLGKGRGYALSDKQKKGGIDSLYEKMADGTIPKRNNRLAVEAFRGEFRVTRQNASDYTVIRQVVQPARRRLKSLKPKKSGA
jgi:hypothetical protein